MWNICMVFLWDTEHIGTYSWNIFMVASYGFRSRRVSWWFTMVETIWLLGFICFRACLPQEPELDNLTTCEIRKIPGFWSILTVNRPNFTKKKVGPSQAAGNTCVCPLQQISVALTVPSAISSSSAGSARSTSRARWGWTETATRSKSCMRTLGIQSLRSETSILVAMLWVLLAVVNIGSYLKRTSPHLQMSCGSRNKTLPTKTSHVEPLK